MAPKRWQALAFWLFFLAPAGAVGQLGDTGPVVENVPVTDTYVLAGRTVQYKEMPRYRRSIFSHGVNIQCNYADYRLLNPNAWDSTAAAREVVEIDLVYSKYPLDTANWRTPFTQLMTNRMRKILALDVRFRLPDVKWNLVAQTDCKTEPEAQALFHGFVVKYRVNLHDIVEPDPKDVQEQFFATVKRIMGGPQQTETLIGKLLDEHPDWKGLTLVMDWTGSMYRHGAELMNWRRYTNRTDALRHLLLFNDGNDFDGGQRRREDKPIGRTGGFYAADPNNVEDVLLAMEISMFGGDGGDSPENDVEALLYAQREYPESKWLLLLADNSPIRDIELVKYLNRPVHIIIVDPNPTFGVHENYLQLAWETGGALYTPYGNFSFTGPRQPIPPQGFVFLGQVYIKNPLENNLMHHK